MSRASLTVISGWTSLTNASIEGQGRIAAVESVVLACSGTLAWCTTASELDLVRLWGIATVLAHASRNLLAESFEVGERLI